MLSLIFLALLLEADFVNHYCEGVIEYRLLDRTRVDCLEEYYATEYDWAKNWYQAIGQSLYYAMHTGKRAGVVLIIRDDKEYRFPDRAYRTIQHYNLPITLWTVREGQDTPVLYSK